jgi:hypothetical protein
VARLNFVILMQSNRRLQNCYISYWGYTVWNLITQNMPMKVKNTLYSMIPVAEKPLLNNGKAKEWPRLGKGCKVFFFFWK